MKMYSFYATDLTGHAEYDIRGEAYRKLMETCCRYSSVLSLNFTRTDLAATKLLNDLEIKKPANIPSGFCRYNCLDSMHFFRVCPELCEILIHTVGGIFEWLNGWGFKNPDDPTFFRSDGTIFFASEIHEGVCIIVPREGEDVEDVLSSSNWMIGDPWERGLNLLETLSAK